MPVVTNATGNELPMPWSGGLNSVQTNTLDVDADGQMDLVLFDRTTDKVSVFRQEGAAYVYAPDWEGIFPDMQYWMLLRDFDGDGSKEIFTGSNAGIRVFKNMAAVGQLPDYQLFKDPIRTLGFSGRDVNLKVDVTDIPSIADIDYDGDLDILNFVPAIGGNIEFHRNMSVENFGSADSLVFEKVTDRWGDFKECGTCNTYIFDGTPCRVRAENHAGSAILALNLNGDTLQDILLGEISCTNLVQLTNAGSQQVANFTSANTTFPSQKPVDIQIFPAPFFEDVDFDGVKDLVVSPNLFFNEGNLTDFVSSNWLYKNVGSNDDPQFEFVQHDFLQAQMLDFGEGAQPLFFDEDGDGDADLLVANRGALQPDGTTFVAGFAFLENTGSDEMPTYSLISENYSGVQSLGLIDIKPDLADVDGDGLQDLYFSARKPTESNAKIYYLRNTATASSAHQFNLDNIAELPISLPALSEPLLIDTDNDGDLDLLVGELNGALTHYRNDGGMNFSLEGNEVGGIGFSTMRRELSLHAADLDGNGKPELLTGDRSGQLNLYRDFLDDLDGTFQKHENWFVNEVTGRRGQPKMGAGVYPATHRNLLMAGTAAGGLLLLKSDQAITATEAAPELQLVEIFPNPAKDHFYIAAKQLVWVTVYRANGKLWKGKSRLAAGSMENYDTSAWPSGLYLVVVQNGQGQKTERLMLLR